MHARVYKYGLKPGDRIVTPKSTWRLVQHHVIYLGQNYQGIDLIIENKVGHGVRIITADQFFNECLEITRIESFKGNGYQRQLAVQRALKQVGQPYNLINYNCESFANQVQHNKVHSRQSKTGFIIAALAIFLMVIAGVFSIANAKKK